MRLYYLVFVLLLPGACTSDLPDEVEAEYQNLPHELDFNIHVKPILSDKCFLCHGPDMQKQQAGLRLDMQEAAHGKLPNHPSKYAIRPGSLSKSVVFERIISDDPEQIMPPQESNLTLTDREKAIIAKWIEEGAEYKPHWAFLKPEKPDVPELSDPSWAKNAIDNFIGDVLSSKGQTSAPEADKETLLRRLTFDLTGLPPTLEQLDAFIKDDSEDAYEKQVDRLLASSHYGEKMAMDWIDLARFADTHGYSIDNYRNMSPWRDWVIGKFNENQPYDEFVTWQLAGDLLENPTKEQVLATAFNRLHPQNGEGGIVDEEFRVEYVVDRVNTVGTAFMALTLGCSKCHDHKYDPISQKEYFQMSGFFNNVNEAGQISYDKAMPVPTMLLTDERKEAIIEMIENMVAGKEVASGTMNEADKENFKKWIENEKYKTLTSISSPKGLIGHFSFKNKSLRNAINSKQVGKMDRHGSRDEKPTFTNGHEGDGLLLDGDAWLDCANVGEFTREQPFSVGLWVKIPEEVKNGVIFHKGIGAALYNFRGYHLAIKDNRLELLMARTTPDNAIMEYADDVPRDQWIQLTVTYDGSSKADGYRVFLNGKELSTTVEVDNLYKDIDFYHLPADEQPGLQVGARWRGIGIGGAVVDDVKVFDRELTSVEVLMVADNRSALSELTTKTPDQLTGTEKESLRQYHVHNYSRSFQKKLKDLEHHRLMLNDSLENIPELMVMKEMPEPRKTYVLNRGQYDNHGEEVFPDVPASVLSWPSDLPKNRLGFARWLMHPDHPLTARVTVNRYWQNYFGTGLVKTTEDFGNQGHLPTHPKLLDWLAVTFRASDWDVKALQKLIVMSATYRQSSRASEEQLRDDPDNVWLARGPALRLSGEMLRDNALLASGLMNDDIGGESVKPYQPAGLWRVNGKTYERDTADRLYRRSLYTLWKRSVPHPTLATFDSPERSECTVRRQKTNTPLQALVLLNDPTFVEASKVIGEQITRQENVELAIGEAFTKLTGRRPKEEELTILKELREESYQNFKNNPRKSKGWLSAGEYKYDEALDADLIAANAVVASTIMNSDAFITKR